MTTKDYGHGRIETRTYYLTTEIEWFEEKEKWCNLHSFGMVQSKVEQQGGVTKDIRYYISSLEDVRRRGSIGGLRTLSIGVWI